MELKKIGSAGDPIMVRRNRTRMNALLPSSIAVFMQLCATVYLFVDGAPTGSIVGSGALTVCYAAISCLLVRKPKDV